MLEVSSLSRYHTGSLPGVGSLGKIADFLVLVCVLVHYHPVVVKSIKITCDFIIIIIIMRLIILMLHQLSAINRLFFRYSFP
jgi:hypothetical protein